MEKDDTLLEGSGHAMRDALGPHIRAAIVFSLAYNLLLLISPLYMLQVYDRVLTSGSVDTLLLLTVLAVVMYGVYAAADAGRRRIFALMGASSAAALEGEIFERGMSPLGSGKRFETAVQELGRVQAFFTGGHVQFLFDMPFSPLFYGLVFLVHPYLGWLTVAGAVIMAAIAWQTERSTRQSLELSGLRDQTASAFLSSISRAYGVVSAMGMSRPLLARWRRLRGDASVASLDASGPAGVLGAGSRSFRQALQTVILGVAAWLVLRNEISSGAIIASSILSGRALAPIDQVIASWKPALRAREGWRNLVAYIDHVQIAPVVTPLPAPTPLLALDGLAVQIPDAPELLLPPMSFTLQPGHILLVLGASGRGKSALLQTLAAAWPAGKGSVSLGGRDLHAWPGWDRGQHIGYLPQSTDLLPGTVRQNIERFSEGDDQPVLVAAQTVGAHDTILTLPNGYDTPVAPTGPISAGQRQLIGLARANYHAPALLLLDEPSASLDQQAVANLIAFLRTIKQDDRVAVVATHDLRLLDIADVILMIEKPQPRLVKREDFVRSMASSGARGQQMAVVP